MEITTPVTEVSEALSETVAQIITNAKSAESAECRDQVIKALEAFESFADDGVRLSLWKIICQYADWDIKPTPWKSTFKVTVKMDYVKMFSVDVDADDEDEAKQEVLDNLVIEDVTVAGRITCNLDYSEESADFEDIAISDWEVPDSLDKYIEITVEELD